MSQINYTNYSVKKNSETSKMIERFFADREEKVKEIQKFLDKYKTNEFISTSLGVNALKLSQKQAEKLGWVRYQKNREFFRPPGNTTEGKATLKIMKGLSCPGGQEFTHNKEYLGVKGVLIQGLRICSAFPNVLAGTQVITVPEFAEETVLQGREKDVKKLKESEYLTLKAKEAKANEKKREP